MTIFTKTQSPDLVVIHDAIPLCHVIYHNLFIIFLYVIPVFYVILNLLKLHRPISINTITTKIENKKVAYLHMT